MKKMSALFVSAVCGEIEKWLILRDSLEAQTDLLEKVLKSHDSEGALSDSLIESRV